MVRPITFKEAYRLYRCNGANALGSAIMAVVCVMLGVKIEEKTRQPEPAGEGAQ